MRTLLLQRICSSFASGRLTAERLLQQEAFEEEERSNEIQGLFAELTAEETRELRIIVEELSRPEARDPKLSAVLFFLTQHHTEEKTWQDHGCIIFNQYYDTVWFVGSEIAKVIPS